MTVGNRPRRADADRPATDGAGQRAAGPVAGGVRVIVATAGEVFRADRAGTVLAGALQAVGAAAALGTVGAGKLALDAVLDPGRAVTGLVGALVLLAVMIALTGSVGAFQSQQQRLLSERVSQRIWGQVMRTTSTVDLIEYERAGFVSRLDRVAQNAIGRPYQVINSLLGLSGSLLGILAMVAVLVALEPLLAPILLVAGVPATILSRRAGRAEFRFATATTGLMRKRMYIRSLLTQRPYAAELRAFDSADRLLLKYRSLDLEYSTALRAHVRVRQGIAMLTTLGVAVSLAAALLAIVELVRRGRLDLAEAGAAAIAVRLLSAQLSGLFGAVGGLIEAVPFLVDLRRFAASAPPTLPAGRRRPLTRSLAVRGVHFTYPDRDRPALDGIDLTVGAGEVVALVGENGSGKTTLAMIVAGLLRPDRGTITWDGDAEVEPRDLRASTSVVQQEFVRYQLSVRDNVTISDPARPAADAEISSVLLRAGAADAVHALDGGIDAVLGRDLDEGTDLSGGQWQRLALARALYRDTAVVILDEPTAALDPRAEHRLFEDVRRILDGRAALLISHRFSSVRLADRIYVLDGGRVLETGTHDELMAEGNRYAELFELQSRAYR